MSEYILGVGQLNGYVKRSLDSDPLLRNLRVRGEISNLSRPGFSGHLYFTLKDESGQIRCVMFRQDAQRLSMRPADGQRVIASGSVSLYPERGEYQLYVRGLRPDGVGSLYEQFERLKARLMAEGLFDPARKRRLPLRPRKIAVVTAETGAVIHDVCRVAAARDASVPILLVPTKVQGVGAAEEIAAALRLAGRQPGVDVVILCRGGGSLEDLWAFNEEAVARAVADCPVPVISGVGHETDTTIADFAADVRAATPSNAAEIAVPERQELKQALRAAQRQMAALCAERIHREERRLLQLRTRLVRCAPQSRISRLQHSVAELKRRAAWAAEKRLTRESVRLGRDLQRLETAADRGLERRGERLRRAGARLEALNVTKVLARGFALVTDERGLVQSAAAARLAERLSLRFRDGEVRAVPIKEE